MAQKMAENGLKHSYARLKSNYDELLDEHGRAQFGIDRLESQLAELRRGQRERFASTERDPIQDESIGVGGVTRVQP